MGQSPSIAAVHEAGHAVATLQTGRAIRFMWARDDKGECIEQLQTIQIGPLDVNSVRDNLMRGVAGCVAEELYSKSSGCRVSNHARTVDPATFKEGSDGEDAWCLATVLMDLTGNTAIAEIELAEEAAAVILSARWVEVLAIATVLDERGELSGEDIDEVVSPCRSRPVL
jgi:hypothetical protein